MADDREGSGGTIQAPAFCSPNYVDNYQTSKKKSEQQPAPKSSSWAARAYTASLALRSPPPRVTYSHTRCTYMQSFQGYLKKLRPEFHPQVLCLPYPHFTEPQTQDKSKRTKQYSLRRQPLSKFPFSLSSCLEFEKPGSS